MKLTKLTEAELLKAYYNFWEANLSADIERFSSYLVDDFSIIGSANGEVFLTGRMRLIFIWPLPMRCAAKPTYQTNRAGQGVRLEFKL